MLKKLKRRKKKIEEKMEFEIYDLDFSFEDAKLSVEMISKSIVFMSIEVDDGEDVNENEYFSQFSMDNPQSKRWFNYKEIQRFVTEHKTNRRSQIYANGIGFGISDSNELVMFSNCMMIVLNSSFFEIFRLILNFRYNKDEFYDQCENLNLGIDFSKLR